jgi:hypothetical protein
MPPAPLVGGPRGPRGSRGREPGWPQVAGAERPSAAARAWRPANPARPPSLPPPPAPAPAPGPPQVTKHHPSSVDLELVKRLVASTKASNMVAFLTREFDCISRGLAGAVQGGRVVEGADGGGQGLLARCWVLSGGKQKPRQVDSFPRASR